MCGMGSVMPLFALLRFPLFFFFEDDRSQLFFLFGMLSLGEVCHILIFQFYYFMHTCSGDLYFGD